MDTFGRTVKTGRAEIPEQSPVVQGSLRGMTILMQISLYEPYLSTKLLEPSTPKRVLLTVCINADSISHLFHWTLSFNWQFLCFICSLLCF